MPLYMTQFAYTPEAVAALARKPEDRAAVLKALIEKLGGRLLGFYYSFGEYDGLVIGESPDATTHLSAVLAAVAPGHLKAVKTTVLFTVDEAMEAMARAGALVYPAPKG
jgi:uncharacterized protein with GYD domain